MSVATAEPHPMTASGQRTDSAHCEGLVRTQSPCPRRVVTADTFSEMFPLLCKF